MWVFNIYININILEYKLLKIKINIFKVYIELYKAQIPVFINYNAYFIIYRK